jgi:hypothetical protein
VQVIRLMQQYQCGWTRFPHLIPLEPATYAIVDDCDNLYLSQWHWYVIREGDYADKRPVFTSAHAVILGESSREIVTMQRIVFERHGEVAGRRVYHRNRNPLDNRFENLTAKRSEIVRRSEESGPEESHGRHDKR